MNANLKQLFGKRLCQLRESHGLKQHQLGRRIGKRDKYISDIETGRIYPRAEIIVKLAEALDVPISTLYFFEGMEQDTKTLRKKIDNLLDQANATQLRKFYRLLLVSTE
jgi:transcriptional regulator with XRE-family HTH domain